MRLAGLGVLGVIAAGLATTALGGRGADLPPDTVARVGDSVITKAEFDREAVRAAREGRAGTGTFQGVPYDPPDYPACVAEKKEEPIPAGGESASDETLRAECSEEFEGLMPAAMESLIEAEWLRQEAKAKGLGMSKAEADRELDEYLKREGASKKQEYEAFLKDSGMTREELLADIRHDLLTDAVEENVTAQASKLSEQETERLANNERRLEEPERRDLRLVLTRTNAQATEVAAALRGGARWSEVAKRYSIDASSRARGGRLLHVTRDELEAGLDEAAFKARTGTTEGPVKTQFGWYVFEVTRIRDARRRSTGQVKRSTKRRLRAEREQVALDEFYEQLDENYRARTVCADDFKVPECGNGS